MKSRIAVFILGAAVVFRFSGNAQVNTNVWVPGDGAKYTKDDGVQGAFQKSNPGKIVFSTKHLDLANISSTQVASAFSTNDNIYGEVLMSTCLSNYKVVLLGFGNSIKNSGNDYFISVFIDGAKQNYNLASGSLGQNISTKTAFSFVLKGENDNTAVSQSSPSFNNSLSVLPPGEHKIKIEVWGGKQGSMVSNTPVATGEFTITKQVDKSAPLGSFSDVQAKMNNPGLESSALSAMKENAKTLGWSENYTEVKIIAGDWSVLRDEVTGAILGRLLLVAVKATWPDGHCTYQEFSMKQSYDGSAYQKPLTLYSIGQQVKIECN